MSYRELLAKAKDLELDVTKLNIANECDCVFNFQMTDDEFEELCEFAYYIYLKSEYLSANAIAQCINHMIVEEGKTIDDVITTEKWKFICRAHDFMD